MSTIILLLASGLAAPPAPLVQCPEPIAAKGEVKSGSALVHSFELTNRGTGPITITRMDASCGCLRRSLSRATLRPAETSTIILEVNTLTQPAGPNRWQVVVGYRHEPPGRAAETGEIVLQMTANLTQEISVTPPQLAISTTVGANQTLIVTDLRSQPLTIIKAETTNPHLTAAVGVRKPREQGGSQQIVAVTLSVDAPTGQTDESVVLTTNDPAYPVLRIPVRIEKRPAGGIVAAPESVMVRFGGEPTEVAALVQLRRADGKSLCIAEAVSDSPGVAVKWSKGASAVTVVRVTVSETVASGGGNGSGTVRVKLADPAGQEIAIPVRWSGTKK